jgi:uncharacterized protein (DUF2384 family)
MIPVVDSNLAASDSPIVTKAALRAADRLNVTNKVLARIIGVSEATVSRMKKGDYPLQAGTKPFELAVLFVRLYRSLDAVVGGDERVAGAWLSNQNVALQDRPLELIQSVSGLTDVIQYLDSRRAVI